MPAHLPSIGHSPLIRVTHKVVAEIAAGRTIEDRPPTFATSLASCTVSGATAAAPKGDIMRSMSFGLAAFVAFAMCCPVQAADVVYSKDHDSCIAAAKGVTFDMIDCMTAETARWDKRLNAGYKRLLAALDPGRQKALTAAEQAWIKFRDTNCDFVFDPNGGTAARMAANSCVLRMTAERALEIESYQPPN